MKIYLDRPIPLNHIAWPTGFLEIGPSVGGLRERGVVVDDDASGCACATTGFMGLGPGGVFRRPCI